MAIRYTIGKKISSGFGILTVLTIVIFIATYVTLTKSSRLNNKITQVYFPSVEKLEELDLMLVSSKSLITNWIYFQSRDDLAEKQKLRDLITKKYPYMKKDLQNLSQFWEDKSKKELETTFKDIDLLFTYYQEVMDGLNGWDSYDGNINPDLLFIREMVDLQGGEITLQTEKVLMELENIIDFHKKNADEASNSMLASFSRLQSTVSLSGIFLIIGGVVIAFFTVRMIVQPVNQLKSIIITMSKGAHPEDTIPTRDDEIGEMGSAMETLVDSIEGTTQFAKAIGSGKFETEYELLSDEDALGKSLLKMRDDLHQLTTGLEEKVKERTLQVMAQKEEIEEQAQKLEKLLHDVTDSIRYAKRLQDSILPPKDQLDKYLPEYFILFKPRDIVSGDFYWMNIGKSDIRIAAADCTGHGVPGAFMSLVSNNMLNQSVKELGHKDPAGIFQAISGEIEKTVQENSKDGMDCAMLRFDKKYKKLEYSGANNPLYWCREGDEEMRQIKADKHALEVFLNKEKEFVNHEINIQKGDTFYIFTDGFPDQFGGPQGRKFMYKKFRNTLFDIHKKPMEEQKEFLDKTIEDWRGETHKQIDDILVIGIRF